MELTDTALSVIEENHFVISDVMITKAVTKKNGKKKKMILGGICSTMSTDLDEESIKVAGVDLSYLLLKGTINWDHNKDTPSKIVGVIKKAEKRDNGIYIEAEILDTKIGREVYELAIKMAEAGKPLGWSIEGKVVERNDLNLKIIEKCIFTAVALTASPKNRDVYVDIIKSLPTLSAEIGSIIEKSEKSAKKKGEEEDEDEEEDKEKSLNTESGAPLMPESLGESQKKRKKLAKSLIDQYKSVNFEGIDNWLEYLYIAKSIETEDFEKKKLLFNFLKNIKNLDLMINDDKLAKALDVLGIKKAEVETAEVEKSTEAKDDGVQYVSAEDFNGLKKSVEALVDVVQSFLPKEEVVEETVEKSYESPTPGGDGTKLTPQATVSGNPGEQNAASISTANGGTEASANKANDSMAKSMDNDLQKSLNSIASGIQSLTQRVEAMEGQPNGRRAIVTQDYMDKSFNTGDGIEKSHGAEDGKTRLSLSNNRRDIIEMFTEYSGINNPESLEKGVNEILIQAATTMESNRSARPSNAAIQELANKGVIITE
jgi:hypothetical protein